MFGVLGVTSPGMDHPEEAAGDSLADALGISGHNVVETLVAAYRRGWFPMADPSDRSCDGIGWYDPDPRGIIPIERDDPAGAFHVPRSLARKVSKRPFLVTSDRAFEQVVRACAEPRVNEPESWIDDRIVRAYVALHDAGHAHSVEAWSPHPRGGGAMAPVGGIYGVTVGGLFAGESMFCRPELGGTDASKVCLVHLVGHLRRRGYTLFDTQFVNPHIVQFGCVEVSREDYRARLAVASAQSTSWGAFEMVVPDIDGPIV